MKTGEVAQRLNVANKTVLNWVGELSEFFSEGAQQNLGLQRNYTYDDLIILNTIKSERSHSASWETIREKLAAGHRDNSLPPETMPLDGDRAIAVYGQLKALEANLSGAQAEIERLHVDNEKKDARIQELNREIGELIAELRFLRRQLEDKE